jgi:hypothetical protein
MGLFSPRERTLKLLDPAWKWATWLCLCAAMAGCNPQTTTHSSTNSPGNHAVETTISADGEMIAALDRVPPHGYPRLRIKRLLPQAMPWEDVPISPHITSIRFGLTGKQLLLTEQIDEAQRSVLVSWDMDQRNQDPTLLYEGYRLVFPLEFKPGHYLVRSCDNGRADWPCSGGSFTWQWEWIHEGQQIQLTDRTTHPEPLLYSQPNVVGERGFFWFTTYKEPRFITTSFKGHQLDTPALPFDENTRRIVCEPTLSRCLERYIKGTTAERKFIFAFRVHYHGQTCLVPRVVGFGDQVSFTPDGLSAITANADSSTLPRAVVVLDFQPGQCEPTSVEFHPFEE